MKKRILTLSLVSILTASAFAYGGGDFRGDRRGGHYGEHQRDGGMKFLSDINLTDEQQRDIELLQVEFRYEQKSNRGEREEIFKSSITTEGFDAEKFKLESLTKATERSTAIAKHIESIFNLLTTEQKTTIYNNLNQ